MDGRHYTDYFNNNLKNQELFCLHLKNVGKFGLIEDDQANPMTLRTILAKEAFDNISEYIQNQKQSLVTARSYSYPFCSSEIYLDSELLTSGSTQNFVAVKNTDENYNQQMAIHRDNYSLSKYKNDIYKLDNSESYLFIIQKYAFQYFTNFGSALDRVAYEIKLLYGENSIEYYSDLTNPSKTSVQNLLSNGYSDIVNITISTMSVDLKDALKYRHRYVHDGILKLLIDKFTGDIKIPDDPRDTNSSFSNNLNDYCNDKFDHLISLLDNIYSQMLNDIS